MTIVKAKSERAAVALSLVESLQRRFVDALEQRSAEQGANERFEHVAWLRDEGRHGGGTRYCASRTATFNQASVNVSCVHYDDDPSRRLSSATALSTIIHPQNPHVPSVHIHVSWTELRDGTGYWRLMADLNPAIEDDRAKEQFHDIVAAALGAHESEAREQGDKYFFIPALARHRGVVHFYLEGFVADSFVEGVAFARKFAEAAIDGYAEIFEQGLAEHRQWEPDEEKLQLAYHTLYFLQVLTLDRGTTSGLLVHDQNDVGILGSLPNWVDRSLLASWVERMPDPQDQLLSGLIGALSSGSPSALTDVVRKELAKVIREHYRKHPEALEMQACGNVKPPTVANHLAPADGE